MRPNLLLLLLVPPVALAMAACSSMPEVRVPEIVKVPTPIACIDQADRPKPPKVRPEADLLALPRGTRTLAAWSDLRKYEIYTAELEAIVEACSRIPPARPP